MNKDRDPPESLLTTEQASEWLNIPVNTLVTWRSQGKGPAYFKFENRHVRYKTADLVQYIEDSKHTP